MLLVALAPLCAMTSIPCCARMDDNLNRVRVVHADRTDCPDAFVTEMNGGYGFTMAVAALLKLPSALGAVLACPRWTIDGGKRTFLFRGLF